MIPTLLELGPFPIHSFGLLMVLGFLAAWRCFAVNLYLRGKDIDLAEKIVFWAALMGVVGGRVGYLLSYPADFFADPIGMLFGSAGFVYYGGFIGGLVGFWVTANRNGERFWPMADLAMPGLSLGYGVGRIGCQLSGDGDYGIVSDLPWAISYKLGVVPTPPGVLSHPTPVYETLGAFAIAALLLWLQRRGKLSGDGQIFGLYIGLAAIARFLVEFIRIEPRVAGELTQAQVISIIMLIIGAALVLLKRPKAA